MPDLSTCKKHDMSWHNNKVDHYHFIIKTKTCFDECCRALFHIHCFNPFEKFQVSDDFDGNQLENNVWLDFPLTTKSSTTYIPCPGAELWRRKWIIILSLSTRLECQNILLPYEEWKIILYILRKGVKKGGKASK